MADETGGIETGAGTATQEGAESAAPAGEAAAAADAPPAWAERLVESFSGFTQRFDAIEQRLPEPEAEDEDEGEPLDLNALRAELDDAAFDQDTGDLTPEGQAQLVQELVRREIRAADDRRFAAEEDARRDREADSLEERYPALRDENTQNEVIGRAEQFCRALRQPALAREPRIIELVWLAMAGEKAAAAERPAAEQQDVHLERSGNAGPADAGASGDDIGDAIVASVRGRQFRTGR